jgi:hypothetical protein
VSLEIAKLSVLLNRIKIEEYNMSIDFRYPTCVIITRAYSTSENSSHTCISMAAQVEHGCDGQAPGSVPQGSIGGMGTQGGEGTPRGQGGGQPGA